MKKNDNFFVKFLKFGNQIHLFEFMFWSIIICTLCIFAEVPFIIQGIIESVIAGAFFNTFEIERKYREKLESLDKKNRESDL